MYRVESFLTSFILSYADKYIRNFNRADAQLSLWEGQATFRNLELNLLALEKLVPFRFVSGHINELKIKLPWTGLGSSSVEVVIDTIECVMKFKSSHTEEDEIPNTPATNQNETQTTQSPLSTLDPNLSAIESTSLTADNSSTSYMQQLIRHVLTNLKIDCNNVILKIIEEDTVLSVNIKSIQCLYVNENWVPAFKELFNKELFVRKRINLHDITVCLDRRSPSGHIVTFVEPLLFKCSLEMRLCQQLDKNGSAIRMTRLDISCDRMSYIVSKPQLYLLLKLMDMVVNLKKVISVDKSTPQEESPLPSDATPPSPPCSSRAPTSPLSPRDALFEKGGTSEETPPTGEASANESGERVVGWWEWMWSYLPSLPEGEDLVGQEYSRESLQGHTLRIGFYMKQLEISLKLLDSTPANDKMKYSQLMSLELDGVFIELTRHSDSWFNLQSGIDSISLQCSGTCCCGHRSSDTEILIFNSQVMRDEMNDVKDPTKDPSDTKEQSELQEPRDHLEETPNQTADPTKKSSHDESTTESSNEAEKGAQSRPLSSAVPPPLGHKHFNPMDSFLDGSLFSAHVKFVPLSKPFLTDHLDGLEEGEMQRRSKMMYVDLVKSLEVIHIAGGEEEDEMGLLQEKMLLRCVLGPVHVHLNASLLHRVLYLTSLVQETISSMQRFTYLADKEVTLSGDLLEMYCSGWVPFNIIQIAILHPVIELSPMVHSSEVAQSSAPVQSGSPEVKLVAEFDMADVRVAFPMHTRVVAKFLEATDQMANEEFVRSLYRKVTVDLTGVAVSTSFTNKTGGDADKTHLEPFASAAKMNIVLTSNQFHNEELANLCELLRKPESDINTLAQNLEFSLADKNCQLSCSVPDLQLSINAHIQQITSHVIQSLVQFLADGRKQSMSLILPEEVDMSV